ncbi:MAG: AAA family ATPase, partial [Sandaracinaceae bacterium]|nr:AAA family ATPase [Sandaracinaceae bacterium]
MSAHDLSPADPFTTVKAQGPALATLRAAIARDKLASAYLFEGPSGTGKAKAAFALAESVIARSTPEAMVGQIAHRIAAGAHPDVRVFSPRSEGSRNLQVEVVRNEVLPFAQFAPFESKSAFVIFPDADVSFPEQHPEAANAMLKTLEEPRPGVHFVLLSARPDRLLQTIRSRCQRVRFQRLPDDVLGTILEAQGVPEASRVVAVALADGRADKALAVGRVGEDGRSSADQLFELALRTDEVAADGRPGAVVGMAEELARSPDLAGVLEALTAFYRDVARASLGMPDEALAFRHQAERIRSRARAESARHAAEAVAGLREVEELIAANANKDLAIADWLFSIGREPMPPRPRKRPV